MLRDVLLFSVMLGVIKGVLSWKVTHIQDPPRDFLHLYIIICNFQLLINVIPFLHSAVFYLFIFFPQ